MQNFANFTYEYDLKPRQKALICRQICQEVLQKLEEQKVNQGRKRGRSIAYDERQEKQETNAENSAVRYFLQKLVLRIPFNIEQNLNITNTQQELELELENPPKKAQENQHF